MFLDLIFLAIFVWAAFRGFTKGLLYQVATLAALIFGILGALKFSAYISEILVDNTNLNSHYLPIISFALTFLIIVIIIHLLSRLLEKVIDAVSLGFLNRLGGAVFSITKYALVISAFLTVVNTFNAQRQFLSEETISKSMLYRPLSRFVPAIFPSIKFEKSREIIEDLNQEIQV